MAKRLMVLLGMLALALATAVPALAESEPQLTGVIEKPEATTYQYGTHSMTDEVGGDLYALQSDVVDLDAYVGQRVTVFGTFVPGYENGKVEGGPPLFDVTRVEPAGPGGPPPGGEITATFELVVECEPPAGTTFFAGASQQAAGLYDPDGDGVYTGSVTLPAGFYDLGAFPVPVSIQAGTPEDPVQEIKNFGEVVLEDGDDFSASVSFCDGGADNGNGGAVVSGDTNDVNKGGSMDGNGSTVASGGAGQGASSIASVLPATGGILPVAAAAGALLILGGLLARKLFR